MTAKLAEELQVSEMTIRRDLIELEKLSIVRRVHGGAVSFYGRGFEPPFISRSNKQVHEKRLIGNYAARQVFDGDSIAIGIGSTNIELALNLIGRKNLTVLTSSLHVANILRDEKNIQFILCGGIVRKTENSMIGHLARYAFSQVHVDKAFLGISGISVDAGFTEHNIQDAQVKKAMIKSAKEVFLLADSSKFNQVAFSTACSPEEVNSVITEMEPPDEICMWLKSHNIDLLIAAENGEHIL